MSEWLVILLVTTPLVAFLITSGLLFGSIFILWIACLMAAVLVAGIAVLLIERTAYHIGRFTEWLKALHR
jgi:hypothetical protein